MTTIQSKSPLFFLSLLLSLAASASRAAEIVYYTQDFNESTGVWTDRTLKSVPLTDILPPDTYNPFNGWRQLRMKVQGYFNDVYVEDQSLEELTCLHRSQRLGLLEQIRIIKGSTHRFTMAVAGHTFVRENLVVDGNQIAFPRRIKLKGLPLTDTYSTKMCELLEESIRLNSSVLEEEPPAGGEATSQESH
jgi:hypothetical protein